jgi:wyosine [tRNA(Phe)-imidazoG37] synthetase (radical SAM superfamily)
MDKKNFKYIYGPVASWRLGSSLGIDPISRKGKICPFDCIYCQIGKTTILTNERKIFVPATEIIKELDLLPSVKIDYITFSGMGEPTLAKNLGQMIKAVKKIRDEKIAVLTNSSLLAKYEVIEDLILADFVIAKIDVPSQKVFERINRPLKTIKFDTVLQAISDFKHNFKGKLALQIMFIEENKEYAAKIARIAKAIKPDEVQVNTPLRPCSVKPLPEQALNDIISHFSGLNVISVYEAARKNVKPISRKNTLARRGKI